MAKYQDSGTGSSDGATANDSIAELVRLAGPRPAVPPHVEQRVYTAVRNEWRSTVRQRHTLRWGLPFALAATIVLAVTLMSRAPEVRVTPIATVALVDGNGGLSVGDSIYPGDSLATGASGMALTVNNGLSLRMAAGTAVTFDSMKELTLRSGRVYVDTGQSVYGDPSLAVHTSVGSARDIGTRFAVAFVDGDMRVAVREGRVDVAGKQGSYTAEAGEVLTLQPDADIARGKISVYDSSWDWAAALAPAFDIENRSLLDFLKWAARETGKELVFEHDAARLAAMKTRLHGSVAGFTPAEAIPPVLSTTSFGYRVRVDEQQIVIADAAD